MRRRLFALTIAALAWAAPSTARCAELPAKQPALVLDVGGHTAPVSRALFTRDGKELITVSKDKTIRFWRLSNDAGKLGAGECVGVLRPPIGPAREGELYAAALSPNGRYLAVAGCAFYHGESKGHEWPAPVFLIDLEAEEVHKVLSGHEFKVYALAFSQDGKRLASAGVDRVIRVWDVPEGKELAQLKGHPGPVTSLAFSADGKRLLSADSTPAPEAYLWAADRGEVVAKLTGAHKKPLTQVAWSPDGKWMATGGDGEKSVALWDGNGKFLKDLDYARGPMTCQSLAFTPDGKGLLVSGKDESKSSVCRLDLAGGKPLYFVQDGNWSDDPRVPAGPAALSPDGRLVAVAGDRSHQVHLYDARNAAWLGECGVPLRPPNVVAWVSDRGGENRTVAWRARALPRDYDSTQPLPERFFDRAFDLLKLRPAPVIAAGKDLPFERNQWAVPGLHLAAEGGAALRLVRGKRPTDIVMKTRWGLVVPEAVSFAGPDRVVFASSDGQLEVYEVGKDKVTFLRDLSGFNGAINSVAPSPDGGRYLLASGEDNVLHVWDPRRPRKDDPTKVYPGRLLSLFVAPPLTAGPRAWAAAEWVAWTPQGYYAASPGGERLMGWHVSNGADKLASFHPASRFRSRFYRPDVIERLLTEGTLEKALESAAKVRGDRDALIVEASSALPPNVKVDISPPRAGKVEIAARATPEGKEPVTGLQLLIDERPWTGKPDKEGPGASDKTTYEAKWTVALPPGPHPVRVLARTASSLGTSRDLVRETEPEKVKPKPSLHVLAIGINDYQKVAKLGAAVRDATELEKVLGKHSAPLFDRYAAKVLTDKEGVVTKKAMLAGFDWLKERQTAADVAVFYYAGHGALVDREFYLVPQDARVQDLAQTGLSRAELKQRVQQLPGKVLVVMDACHSGAAGLLFDDVSRELADEDCGVVAICAAHATETAQERQNGFLTLSLMEGLQGKAPVKQADGHVYLRDLQWYVAGRVEELSDDRQHAIVLVPPWMRSFGLSKP